MPSPKRYTREHILYAMKHTRSNKAASRFLGCNYNTYKTYAEKFTDDNGVTLYEVHKNPSGLGIARVTLKNKLKPRVLENILEGKGGWESIPSDRLKQLLLREGHLLEECAICGFKERRVTDLKIPLLINFKDKSKTNWKKENLEMLCYNHYFLTVGNILEQFQIRATEDAESPKISEFEWELDEDQINNMRELGLLDPEEDMSGDEFVSYK